MFFAMVMFFVAIFVFYNNQKKSSIEREKIVIERSPELGMAQVPPPPGIFSNPGYSYSNLPGDVLLNPYEPPLKDDAFVVPGLPFIPPGRVPVNVPTNIGSLDVGYRQYGILKPIRGPTKDSILPLMGRPVNTSRQKFQYYTISNQHNNVKLPIIVRGRSGTTEYGVDELFSGERVLVEGDKMPYEVRVYENDSIRYIPYI
jgi:hypothetical protein